MGRRDALDDMNVDGMVDGLLADAPELLPDAPEDERKNGSKDKRESRPTPHERKRASRQMSVTYPSPGWVEAIRDLADEWEVRPADVMVLFVSRGLRAVEDGDLARPNDRPARFHERAGEPMGPLPWEPVE